MRLFGGFAEQGNDRTGVLGLSSTSDVSSVIFFEARAKVDQGNAHAARVNRTHRVVQERARTIAARRSRIRSLWLPMVLFSTLLIAVCTAVWALLDEYELAAAGSQVSSYQILVPLFWSIPVSAALLAIVWFRQSRGERARSEAGQGSVE